MYLYLFFFFFFFFLQDSFSVGGPGFCGCVAVCANHREHLTSVHHPPVPMQAHRNTGREDFAKDNAA